MNLWVFDSIRFDSLDCGWTNRLGYIPKWLGALGNHLVILDLGENDLEGEVPSQLSKLSSLELLFVQSQQGDGYIAHSTVSSLQSRCVDKNSIGGSAKGPICHNLESTLLVFVSNCGGKTPEFDCHCCMQCCQDDNADCNKDLLLISYNPMWEGGYKCKDYIVAHAELASQDGAT